jgi:pimeloyl-ACP methyl ester carboxylesterase
MAGLLDPAWGERLPLERMWPLLKRATDLLEAVPRLEHDWFTRACVRVAYYSACPDTRVAFVSASRELALDPPHGEQSVWARLEEIEVPAVFLWAGRDRLIPRAHSQHLEHAMPRAEQMEVPCSGHFVNFRHYRCMEHAIALATGRALERASGVDRIGERVLTPCLAEQGWRAERMEEEGESEGEGPACARPVVK